MYATDVRQTDVRQHHRLMPLGRWHPDALSDANQQISLDLILSLSSATPEREGTSLVYGRPYSTTRVNAMKWATGLMTKMTRENGC